MNLCSGTIPCCQNSNLVECHSIIATDQLTLLSTAIFGNYITVSKCQCKMYIHIKIASEYCAKFLLKKKNSSPQRQNLKPSDFHVPVLFGSSPQCQLSVQLASLWRQPGQNELHFRKINGMSEKVEQFQNDLFYVRILEDIFCFHQDCQLNYFN